MGWCDESGEHEGYVAQVFADGERGSATSGQGVHVWPGGGPGVSGDIEREETRPYADVTAWRVDCECGWSGGTYPLADERPEDIDTRWAEPTEAREDQLREEWRRHVAPFNAVYLLDRLAAEARALDDRISGEVALARRDGASWSHIGQALGMTKQGAQQRYGS